MTTKQHYSYRPHLSRACIEPIDAGSLYVLTRSLPVDPAQHGMEGKARFMVPQGFVTDGASIPRFFWRVVDTPFSPDIITGAVAHDFLFSRDSDHLLQWDFNSANQLFHGILRSHGNGKTKCNAMLRAIKWCGKGSYKKGYSWEKTIDA